jgi:hypothetical protein
MLKILTVSSKKLGILGQNNCEGNSETDIFVKRRKYGVMPVIPWCHKASKILERI